MWYDTRPDPPTRINLTVFSFFPFRFIFFSFSSFSFPEKRSRWRSSRRIRTRRMPCSTSSWVSHSCKGVSSSLFLNASCENRTRFVTVIFLFAGGASKEGQQPFFFHCREMEIEGIEVFFEANTLYWERQRDSINVSCSKLLESYWKSSRCQRRRKKKKEKEAENWPQNLLTSIHFFIRNRPRWSDE